MNKTNIEYLDYTWNPVKMRCAKCSPGCENCWHLAQCEMRKNNPKLPQRLRDVYAGTATFYLDEKELNCSMPKKPARIGVQFMGDLFHESVPFEWIDRIMTTIAREPQHTFIVLSKRPERMKAFFEKYHHYSVVDNYWLGVTVCNQDEADRKIPILLQIPAAVRFVSIEPVLGAVDFPGVKHSGKCKSKIDWVICGGESGPNARPLNPQWVYSLLIQCKNAGVPFFFKQWGEYSYINGRRRIGKKKAGNRINGIKYEQFPEINHKIHGKHETRSPLTLKTDN